MRDRIDGVVHVMVAKRFTAGRHPERDVPEGSEPS